MEIKRRSPRSGGEWVLISFVLSFQEEAGEASKHGMEGKETRDHDIIKVNSSWPMHGINKLMLRQRKA